MIETILVFLIVAGAIIYLITVFYKHLHGKSKGCACDESCSTCNKTSDSSCDHTPGSDD
ncbi:MAG: FeoB-associated Cys-rich membrane protein [Proteobacteria bacterium]|nr:FeoB-associated Cys-rich membrane protein [Pseudomonadota bacterium]